MDPRTAADELAERLRAAHVHAGGPALSALETAVGYRSETLSEVLAGALVPSWVLVRELGAVFGVSPDVVVQDWFALWTAANIHRGRHDADRGRTPAAPASDTTQPPTARTSATQVSASQTSAPRISASQTSATQVSASQTSATRISASQTSATQISATQVSATQVSATQIAPPQTSATETAATETAAPQATDARAAANQTSGAQGSGTEVSAVVAAQTGYTCAECGSWVVDTARHTDWHEAMEAGGRPTPLAESLGPDWDVRSHDINMLRVALGTHERNR
jgi:hypothetical protein